MCFSNNKLILRFAQASLTRVVSYGRSMRGVVSDNPPFRERPRSPSFILSGVLDTL